MKLKLISSSKTNEQFIERDFFCKYWGIFAGAVHPKSFTSSATSAIYRNLRLLLTRKYLYIIQALEFKCKNLAHSEQNHKS